MNPLPRPAPRTGPKTTAQTRCRRLGNEFVDILGFSETQLEERRAWCRSQAVLLEGVSTAGLAERVCEEWDVSAAEAAWVVSSLMQRRG